MVKEGVFWFQRVSNADAGFRGFQEVSGGFRGEGRGVSGRCYFFFSASPTCIPLIFFVREVIVERLEEVAAFAPKL